MVASVALSGASDASKVARLRLEGRGVLGCRLLECAGDGGGHGGHTGDVVPEVRVGVAPCDVEHGRRVHDSRAAPVRTEERAHPGVVSGAVLDHDLCLGQGGGVAASVSKRWGSALGFVMSDVTGDVSPADLAGDVAPEVLGRHDVHDIGRAGRGAGAAGQAESGEGDGGGSQRQGDTLGSHNRNGNHFG